MKLDEMCQLRSGRTQAKWIWFYIGGAESQRHASFVYSAVNEPPIGAIYDIHLFQTIATSYVHYLPLTHNT